MTLNVWKFKIILQSNSWWKKNNGNSEIFITEQFLKQYLSKLVGNLWLLMLIPTYKISFEYLQDEKHWVIGNGNIQVHHVIPKSFPKRTYQFTILPAVYNSSHCSTRSPTHDIFLPFTWVPHPLWDKCRKHFSASR